MSQATEKGDAVTTHTHTVRILNSRGPDRVLGEEEDLEAAIALANTATLRHHSDIVVVIGPDHRLEYAKGYRRTWRRSDENYSMRVLNE